MKPTLYIITEPVAPLPEQAQGAKSQRHSKVSPEASRFLLETGMHQMEASEGLSCLETSRCGSSARPRVVLWS